MVLAAVVAGVLLAHDSTVTGRDPEATMDSRLRRSS